MQIQDKALLVRLSIGLPGNSRKDKPLTAEVTAKHQLTGNAGRWLKTLYPPTAFEPITAIAGDARTFHYANTLPWMDDGMRILPTQHHGTYTSEMRVFKRKFLDTSETHFLCQLSQWESEARVMHNGTFNPADYLPECKLRKKFSFATEFQPVPSSDDFRVSIANGEMAQIKAELDERLAQAVADAQADLWRRLADPLAKMIERLKDPTATFRDSLVGNLGSIVELIPALNLAADKHLEQFASEVKLSLGGLNPQQLRDFPSARNAAAVRAQDILERMSGYFPASQS